MGFDEPSHIQRFCRICMASSASEAFPADIYCHEANPDQPTLGTMLSIICGSVFSKESNQPHDTGMPNRVCSTCEHSIVAAYRLHQQCIETDRKLRELLLVKQEPLVDENDFMEETAVDPILDFEASECRVKVEEQEDDESMCVSKQSTVKLKKRLKRSSSRKNQTVTAFKEPIKKSKLNKKVGLSKELHEEPERKRQKRIHAICEFCSQWFHSYVRLNTHLAQSHPDRVNRCEICQTTFLDESEYEEHRQFHITGKRFGCSICGKRFKLKKSLAGHLITHTNIEPSPCPECGKMFKNADSLRNHILRHKRQTTFPCTQCPVKSASMAKLKSHMLTHTKEKNHVCESCGSRFTVADSLQTHIKNVHGERNFTCKTCNLKFTCSNHLARHMRIHTGEKPYKCAYCDRAYAQSNDLVKHSRIHVGDKPYACDRCSEAFRLGSELRDHYKVHYSEAEANATGAMFGGIANKAIFSIADILKRRFEAEQQKQRIVTE